MQKSRILIPFDWIKLSTRRQTERRESLLCCKKKQFPGHCLPYNLSKCHPSCWKREKLGGGRCIIYSQQLVARARRERRKINAAKKERKAGKCQSRYSFEKQQSSSSETNSLTHAYKSELISGSHLQTVQH